MKYTILYIEDDREIGAWSEEFLKANGYEVIWITSGEAISKYIERIDLVLLDVMLPGIDGFSVGQRLKQAYPDTPIMLLTARSAIEDKVQGLAFADDYMTKPFHPEELTARIQVLLRRTRATKDDVELDHLRIDRKANRIFHMSNNTEITLTGKQFHIFMFLLNHPNQILTQKQIYEAVWQEPYMNGDKTLMVHIRHLREKLELDPSQPKLIETIRGVGYRLRMSSI